MKTEEAIVYISIAVMVVSLFFIGTKITGFAVTDNKTGIVNVSIESAAALNFTTALYDFGLGAVDAGLGARLYSNSTTIDGTWTQAAGFLTLQNIGNVNVTLNLSSNKTVGDFIGGTTPEFKILVTENESGACTGTPTFNTYQDITTTPQTACTDFNFDTDDSINIDIQLFVPNDATGARTVGIVAIGEYTE